MKELIIAENMVALARGHNKAKKKPHKANGGKAHVVKEKSAGQKRSAMLRMIMPFLSRETGEKLAIAIEQRSSAKFSQIWDQVKKEIVRKLDDGKHKATASSVKIDIPEDMLITVLQMVCQRLCEGKDPCPLPPVEEEVQCVQTDAQQLQNLTELYRAFVSANNTK